MDAYLFIILADRPRLVQLPAVDSPGEIIHGGVAFREIESHSGEFLGFYDWLRDSGSVVLGFRLTLHDEALGLRRKLPEHPYMTWEGEEILLVRLLSGELDESLSVDQEFSVARAFRSSSGEACVLLDAAELDAADLAALGCEASPKTDT